MSVIVIVRCMTCKSNCKHTIAPWGLRFELWEVTVQIRGKYFRSDVWNTSLDKWKTGWCIVLASLVTNSWTLGKCFSTKHMVFLKHPTMSLFAFTKHYLHWLMYCTCILDDKELIFFSWEHFCPTTINCLSLLAHAKHYSSLETGPWRHLLEARKDIV